jgi:hypothetical protein
LLGCGELPGVTAGAAAAGLGTSARAPGADSWTAVAFSGLSVVSRDRLNAAGASAEGQEEVPSSTIAMTSEPSGAGARSGSGAGSGLPTCPTHHTLRHLSPFDYRDPLHAAVVLRCHSAHSRPATAHIAAGSCKLRWMPEWMYADDGFEQAASSSPGRSVAEESPLTWWQLPL